MSNDTKCSHYIYLLQEREFIKTKENIYKVGRTEKENHSRFNQYSKGSVLLFQMICNDCKSIERQIINLFKEKFIQRKDIGNEYFEGDFQLMIDIIYSTIRNETKITDISSDDDKKSENMEETPFYQLTTYEEWSKLNNIDVIITTKEGNGFLRYNNRNQLWREIYDKNSSDFDYTRMEHLSGYIELANTYLSKKDEYEYINVNVCVDKIFQDTIKKCYVKNYDSYNLKYYEYVFRASYNESHENVIFNCLTFTYTPVDMLIKKKVLNETESGSRIIRIKNVVNIEFVNNILNALITPEIKHQYKKLVYNLIVKQEEPQIIFYDYNDCLLSGWIHDIIYAISSDKFYVYSSQYYDDKLEFKKLLKKQKLRYVVINKYKNISITTQIKDFSKLGFKNIIVRQNETNNMYNIINFKKYLIDNKELLIKCIKEENNYEPVNWETEIAFNDSIFYKTDLLFTNFLKWCCT
jgi:hypothetical protein